MGFGVWCGGRRLHVVKDQHVVSTQLARQDFWDSDNNYSLQFLESPVQNSVIMKSAYLKDLFSEVVDSTDVAEMEVCDEQSYVSWT